MSKQRQRRRTRRQLQWLAASVMPLAMPAAFAQQSGNITQLPEVEVLGTAEQAWKQAPGSSVVTQNDLATQPGNDLDTVLRKQPGVNLTGNSTSGQRGNNRQIDLRGMGPENTLILIDGKPVNSRKAVRYGWRGERDTRGDMNWMPTEAIDHVEVLRGPAAARYGNGAAGGVVNIITKGTPEQFSGSATLYYSHPQHKEEGGARRASFSLGGPLSDMLGFRLTGNIAKTDADAWDINKGHASTRTGPFAGTFPAGREGVRNRDLDARLSLKPNAQHRIDLDAGFSRQGNIYTGDTQNTNNYVTQGGRLSPTAQRVQDALGSETNRMYRSNYALTHTGKYGGGASSTAYIQYEATRNTRLDEGLAGGTEGLFSGNTFGTAKLDTATVHGEYNQPGKWGDLDHVITLGAEAVSQKFDDPNSVSQATTEGGTIAGLASTGRSSKINAKIYSIFVEDNIELTPDTILTPGVRFDHHSKAGNNWSPSLNLSHSLTREITLKAGVARAYKAPNLYQLNPNYLLYSRGIGCWGGGGGACYLMGNSNLKAETSINKELGIEFANNTVVTGLTYFHNDYRDKIEAGRTSIGKATGGSGNFANANIFQWDNVPKALVTGLEGTFNFHVIPRLEWSNNLTYMIKSENKSTGEQLSIIPKYTLNSRLEWKATDDATVFGTATFYGKQKANKLDYQGLPAQGEEAQNLSPYTLIGLGGNYAINRNLKIGLGVDNIFDKRLFRRGNAIGVNNPRTIYGAGAATYNEPGRTFYVTLTSTL